jgi:hypothetical protein
MAFVMETSMLHNAEILVNLYGIVGAVHYLQLDVITTNRLPQIMSVIFPSITCAILYHAVSLGSRWKYTMSFPTILILAFVADAIFLFTRFLFRRFIRGTCCRKQATSNGYILVTYFSFVILLTVVLGVVLGSKTWIRLDFFIGITVIGLIYLLSLLLIANSPKEEAGGQYATYYDSQLQFVTLVFWILPFIAIGDMYSMFKGINAWSVFANLFPIIVRLSLAIFYVHPTKIQSTSNVAKTRKRDALLRTCRFGSISLCSWRLLTLDIDHQMLLHPLPTLILTATACDVIEILLAN